MVGFGNLALACLLGVTGCSAQADGRWQGGVPNAPQDPFLVLPPGTRPQDDVAQPPRDLGQKVFTLRHIYHHGSHDYPNLHRYLDVSEEAQLYVEDEDGRTRIPMSQRLVARTVTTNIQRMADRSPATIDGLLRYAALNGEAAALPSDAWTIDEIAAPNATDKGTVITFAKIAANAYVEEPFTGDWKDVKSGFNHSSDFGWEEDGLRGHIFTDETNKTIIIGLKGTSPALFDGAETTGNDKLNDNLFGSCCCAQGGHTSWKSVCDCMTEAFTCNQTCLVKSLNEKDHYFKAAQDLYTSVKERYPDAENIWLSGHSLGGVVSSLLGLLHGLPVMTFEAFPDALAASRLGLPTPPGYRVGAHQSRPDTAIHHFGHTADPVFAGSCNGLSSTCSLWGYAFESSCHTGKKCRYDTVKDLGWGVSIFNHQILKVIDKVLDHYDEVADCKEDLDCTDCFSWKFYESNSSSTTTSKASTSTRTRTRTETCKTPGWWGCLDKTTTTTATTTTSSSSSSTMTCKTPGWFGCKDPTTTTLGTSPRTANPTATPVPIFTTTISQPTPSRKITSTRTASPTSRYSPTTITQSSTSTHTTCTSRVWFGLICIDPSPDVSSTPSPTKTPPRRRRGKCIRRNWFGRCRERQREVDEEEEEEAEPKWDLKM